MSRTAIDIAVALRLELVAAVELVAGHTWAASADCGDCSSVVAVRDATSRPRVNTVAGRLARATRGRAWAGMR
jgi:hypothetical protein